jgi:DNA replication protein DnaC
VLHRAVNAYKVLIFDEIGYPPMTREQANCSSRSSRSLANAAQ